MSSISSGDRTISLDPNRSTTVKAQFHLPLATYPDPASFNLLQNAVALARHHHADLNTSVHKLRVPNIISRFPTALDVAQMSADAERCSADAGAALIQTLQDYAKQAEVSLTVMPVETTEPLLADKIAQLSRLYELTILEASTISRAIIERVLFASGRPLLLFPLDAFSGRVDTVAIAWDGSLTIARALTGAWPFLDNADKIVLISITDDKSIDLGLRDQFAAVLHRSGHIVDTVTTELHDQEIAARLQTVAIEHRADLLVAGGFGHSRLREFVLGGATWSLLGRLELPVLLCH